MVMGLWGQGAGPPVRSGICLPLRILFFKKWMSIALDPISSPGL
jgi:hypothetical protein